MVLCSQETQIACPDTPTSFTVSGKAIITIPPIITPAVILVPEIMMEDKVLVLDVFSNVQPL